MAEILLTTQGTAGDVYPLIKIGGYLKAGGQAVTLITHCCYAETAERAGLRFVALDEAEEFDRYQEASAHLVTPPDQIMFIRAYMLPKARLEYDLIRQRYRPGETLLVSNHLSSVGAKCAAEKLGLPLVRVFTAVAQVTRLSLLEEMFRHFLAADVNRLRESIGLSPIHDWRAWLSEPRWSMAAWPDWFAFPEPTAPPGITPIGFLANLETDAEMTEELCLALAGPERPILITGGTSLFLRPEFYSASVEACRRLGRRAILVTPHRRLIPEALPPGTMWFERLPFMRVMPQVSVVIHHAGPGTLAFALAAGVPQLALAAGTDRPDTAARLQRLGVAEYLPPSQWQPEAILAALKRLVHSTEVQARCQEFAQRMRAADPAAAVCRLAEGALADSSTSLPDAGLDSPSLFSEEPQRVSHSFRPLADLSPEKRAWLALRLRQARK